MWYIEMGGMYNINGQKIFGRKIYVEPNKISEIRKKFNNLDVYATILSYNKEVQNDSDLYGPMYLDLDLNIEIDGAGNVISQDVAAGTKVDKGTIISVSLRSSSGGGQ